MEPTIAILIWTIVLVLVAPVIVACVFLSSPEATLKISWDVDSFVKKIRYYFPDADTRMERELIGRHDRAKAFLILCRRSVAEAIDSEQQIRASIERLTKRISDAQLETLNQSKADSNSERKIAGLKDTLTDYQQKLILQEVRTESMREKLTELEKETQEAYTQKQIAIAQLRGQSALRRADAILSKSSSQAGPALTAMENMEKIVTKHEEVANKAHALRMQNIEKTFAKIDAMDPEKSLASKIRRYRYSCAERISKTRTSVVDAFRKIDPSLERAFRRLQIQLEQARRSAKNSQSAEQGIEVLLGHERTSLEQLKSRDVKPGSADNSAQISHAEQSLEFMSDGLKVIKVRNLSTQQTLYSVEAIVRRLSILKMLISASPLSRRDMRSQFIELSNCILAYLQQQQQNSSADTNCPSVNIVERLHILEQSTLMKYLQFAKSETEILNQNIMDRLKVDVAMIAEALDFERADAYAELEKWTTVAISAEADNQQLLLAVAQSRTARCSEILKMTEQTLDVLNLTISLAEKRGSQAKAS